MSARPPLACAALWQTVTTAAGGRCQCSGACGSTHAKSGGRCDRTHGGWAGRHGGMVHLVAAPTDPADMLLPPHKAAALPTERLAAWCPSCHDATRNAARRQARTEPPQTDALFAI
ncbi:hypothetical protein [Kitasatospora sp. MBT63]|uniref:hypothetical protein n=1 Tax=Kitasatospora sp. MBT63 TaxID=1444768 RepID=UPI00053AA8D2|nr:hypothetical protein [Kitasatospora sp. MBT63]